MIHHFLLARSVSNPSRHFPILLGTLWERDIPEEGRVPETAAIVVPRPCAFDVRTEGSLDGLALNCASGLNSVDARPSPESILARRVRAVCRKPCGSARPSQAVWM